MKINEIITESDNSSSGILEQAIAKFVKGGRLTGLRDYGPEEAQHGEDKHDDVIVMDHSSVPSYIQSYVGDVHAKPSGSLLKEFSNGKSIVVCQADSTESFSNPDNHLDHEQIVSDLVDFITDELSRELGPAVSEQDFSVGDMTFKQGENKIAVFWENIELDFESGSQVAAVISIGVLKMNESVNETDGESWVITSGGETKVTGFDSRAEALQYIRRLERDELESASPEYIDYDVKQIN